MSMRPRFLLRRRPQRRLLLRPRSEGELVLRRPVNEPPVLAGGGRRADGAAVLRFEQGGLGVFVISKQQLVNYFAD